MPESRTSPDPRYTRRWKNLRAKVLEQSSHCWICGKPLRKDLPGTHRLGPTVDHVVEPGPDGDWFDESNLAACCRSCNSRKGQAYGVRLKRERIRLRARARELNPSRPW
jgi:5-methylcytosine-specific restriction endonuclease McrA